MEFTTLPPEFSALTGRVQWVQRVNENEYTSSCPNCGIQPHHNDSNPSNRFIMWLESRETGKPFGMCFRHCGWRWTPGKQDVQWTDEEKAAFVAKRRELNEREEKRIREYSQSVVMKQKVYVRYIERMKESQYGKIYLQQKGFVSDEWNKYFGFGIFEDYKCHGKLDTYYSPAITIPIIGLEQVIENVKMRVTEAHHKDDRFRNLYKTKAQHPYFPMKDLKVANKVAIFEGEFKSCTVAMNKVKTHSLPEDVQIIATQGKGIGGRMAYILEKCEVVYLCLDPDAYEPNDKGNTGIMQSARKLGYDRVRIIPCREKIDDAILQGFDLRAAYNMAVKPFQLGLKP